MQKTESTHSRSYIAAFRPDGSMLWSTQYGMGDENTVMDICASGNKVWMVGSSDKDWTFEEYVPGPGSDYFRYVNPSLQLQEATIARFDIPLILSDGSYNRDQENNLALYPNPNDGHFILENKFTMSSVPFELSIFNVLGEVVHKQLVMQRQSSLNLSHLAPGCYHVLIQANGNGSSTKFIINQ